MSTELAERLTSSMRTIPDFPKPGILFYDITTALQNGPLFHDLVSHLAERCRELKVDAIVGMESRGFIFGAPIAAALGISFVPVRKPGKLPADIESASYVTEYSEETLEIHCDALGPGHRVAIIDDLIATGGTVEATVALVEKLGAEVAECIFIIELVGLKGKERIPNTPTHSLLQCD